MTTAADDNEPFDTSLPHLIVRVTLRRSHRKRPKVSDCGLFAALLSSDAVEQIPRRFSSAWNHYVDNLQMWMSGHSSLLQSNELFCTVNNKFNRWFKFLLLLLGKHYRQPGVNCVSCSRIVRTSQLLTRLLNNSSESSWKVNIIIVSNVKYFCVWIVKSQQR